MIDGFLNPMNKEEFRMWEDYIISYNHNNELKYTSYNKKVLDLKK